MREAGRCGGAGGQQEAAAPSAWSMVVHGESSGRPVLPSLTARAVSVVAEWKEVAVRIVAAKLPIAEVLVGRSLHE